MPGTRPESNKYNTLIEKNLVKSLSHPAEYVWETSRYCDVWEVQEFAEGRPARHFESHAVETFDREMYMQARGIIQVVCNSS